MFMFVRTSLKRLAPNVEHLLLNLADFIPLCFLHAQVVHGRQDASEFGAVTEKIWWQRN